MKKVLYTEISAFCKSSFMPDSYFACAYGSYASGYSTRLSDFDMFVAVKEYSEGCAKKFENFFIDLHKSNHLVLDNEVPYHNKLVVSYKDIKHACDLTAFQKGNSSYAVPIIKKHADFLSSPEVRWRLLLNALTSPHEFICGDYDQYSESRITAESSIVRLAHKLLGSRETPAMEDVLQVLTVGPSGEQGEMYLGYKQENQVVIGYLSELIIRNNDILKL